ncbi:MAG: gluconate 2-dehydrogenase subunit 3 family protein, partial [Flavobacteriaceae bacterium]|nr:gluconate 2-dehydrogenase subunit 3 family protein [Flavobacteriaceae bacterium]
MERRQVLKNLGLGAGFLVASPSIMSLLQSCTSEPEFNPVFLSKGEGHALRRIVDLIIPSD